MTTVACDGSIYSDGVYFAICSREKLKRSFYGVVRVTETGRVVVEGSCDGTGGERSGACGTLITKVLCSG